MKTLEKRKRSRSAISLKEKKKKGGPRVQLPPPSMDEVPLVAGQGSLTRTSRQRLAELTRAECVKAGSAGPLGTSGNVGSLSSDRTQTP